jgi:hypothetical protein
LGVACCGGGDSRPGARQLASNIRYQFIHHPLSDLFLVYNDTRFHDTGLPGGFQPPSRAVILKLTHLLSFQ